MNNTMILRGSERLARDTRLVFALLEKIWGGLLEVRLPDGSNALFGNGEHGVSLQVHNEATFGMVLAQPIMWIGGTILFIAGAIAWPVMNKAGYGTGGPKNRMEH